MAIRLAEMTSSAAAVQLHAVSVGLLARGTLAEPAGRLAAAARDLATAAVQRTDINLNQMVDSPDFTDFDKSFEAFREQAMAAADE
jgi:hypothetical protein